MKIAHARCITANPATDIKTLNDRKISLQLKEVTGKHLMLVVLVRFISPFLNSFGFKFLSGGIVTYLSCVSQGGVWGLTLSLSPEPAILYRPGVRSSPH